MARRPRPSRRANPAEPRVEPFDPADNPDIGAAGPSREDQEIVKKILAYKNEAEDARKERMYRNERNRNANLGRQDWSHKIQGQSREFLPKVHMAAEQLCAFIKRALTQFGQWFQVEARFDYQLPLRDEQIEALVRAQLENIYVGNGRTLPFSTILTDGIKIGLFESLVILKIHGEYCEKRRFYVEPARVELDETGSYAERPEELKTKSLWPWKLRIDLIRPDDYYPDPSGRLLYEIHEVERDLFEIVELAERGIYDKQVVMDIHEDFIKAEDAEREAAARGQQVSHAPQGRKRVKLLEFWGTLLDDEGLVEHKNIVATVANEKYLIRKPEPNPFWHQQSPFVTSPLIRVPLSVWHKALYDEAVDLNFVLNEMFNLMLDGGLASVWGIRQIRTDELENPEEVTGGIPQGATLAVKSTLPHNAKVLENLTEGQIPQDAMAIFEMIGREFNQAALTNDIKLGSLPNRQVTATEVQDAAQSQATTLDAITADVENELIVKTIQKSFLTVLQHMEDMDTHDLVNAIGPGATYALAQMSTAQRYAAFANGYNFKVYGLSATLARARDFQRLMALFQAIQANPLLLQVFAKRFSPEKALRQIMKMLNINPESINITPEEEAQLGQTLQELPMWQQLSGGGRADGAGETGRSNVPAEIDQLQNPLTGMGGGS